MRHIKTFKIFETHEEEMEVIIDNAEEIKNLFYDYQGEFSDSSIDVEFYDRAENHCTIKHLTDSGNDSYTPCMRFPISSRDEDGYINLDDFEGIFYSLQDRISSQFGLEMSIEHPHLEDSLLTIEDFMDTFGDDEIYCLELYIHGKIKSIDEAYKNI